MKSAPSFSLAVVAVVLFTGCAAQVRNARTVEVAINGNCEMCEKTIEAAALTKGMSMADWNSTTRTATITFDSTRTDADAVLKRIAQAGYDNGNYLAPDAVYAALPMCCQYERTGKHIVLNTGATDHGHSDHSAHDQRTSAHAEADTIASAPVANEKADHLKPVFDTYFALKDALVASDANAAAQRAAEFATAVKAVQMERMTPDVHGVWMTSMTPLAAGGTTIATSKDLEKQRKAFAELSAPMLALVKVAPRAEPVYYDHCPMYEGGADWLSMEKPIKNPFYGSMMLTCGSVKQTIP